MVRAPALVALLLLVAPWESVQGERFDVLSRRLPAAERGAAWAETTGVRFHALFGRFPGTRGAVVLADGEPDGAAGAPWDRDGATWKFCWPRKVPTLEDLQKYAPGSLTPDMVRTITREDEFRRELSVATLDAFVRTDPANRLPREGYGSPLPDWLDVACGAYHESEPSREIRRKRLAGAVANLEPAPFKGGSVPMPLFLVPLRDLFTNPRPEPPRVPEIPPEIGPETRKRIEAILEAAVGEPYPDQCLSVLEFLLERYGEEFFRHVVAVQGRGERVKAVFPWLRAHAKVLRDPGPKIPESVQELQDAWWEWLRNRAATK